MKKLDIKGKLRCIRRSKSVSSRKFKLKRKATAYKLSCRALTRIHAPVYFTINDDQKRHKLLKFISRLRSEMLISKNGVCLDFSATKQLVADGMLLFVAELNRAIKLSGNKIIIRCVPPKKIKLKQVFLQIGLFKLFKYKYRGIRSHDEDVVHWRYASGILVEGKAYEQLLGQYDGRIAESLSSKLYVGLVEGMKNVRHHAHISMRKDGLGVQSDIQGWWMFSQERKGYLSVLLCDLGVGIPDTLPVKHQDAYQALLRRLVLKSAQLNDSEIISEATELMKSRTLEEHRGRGLGQMVNAITGEFEGRVCIHSNKGCYTNSNGNVALREYNSSILGTLIYWTVPLKMTNEDGS